MVFIAVSWLHHCDGDECKKVLRTPKISNCWSLCRTNCNNKETFQVISWVLEIVPPVFQTVLKIDTVIVSRYLTVSSPPTPALPSFFWFFHIVSYSCSAQLRPLLHVGSAPACRQHLYCPWLSSSCWASVPEIQLLPRCSSEVCQGSQAETVWGLQQSMPGFPQ